MAAMNEAAKTNPQIAKRIDLFRYRVPEEFYDLEKDPDCLVNLIDAPQCKTAVEQFRSKLEQWMVETHDPMLEALRNRDDRSIVDRQIEKTYGKVSKPNVRPKKQ